MPVLGLADNHPVSISPEHLLRHTAIIGQSGSGKSYFLARLLEEIILRTGAQVVVIDPNGDFRRFWMVSDVWTNNDKEKFAEQLGKIAESHTGDDSLNFDRQEGFEKAWNWRQFIYQIVDSGFPETFRLPNHDNVLIKRAFVQPTYARDEFDFLLDIDPTIAPEMYYAFDACKKYIEDEDLDYTLGSLRTTAQRAATDYSVLAAYSVASRLDQDIFRSLAAKIDGLMNSHGLFRDENRGGDLLRFLENRPSAAPVTEREHAWNAFFVDLGTVDKQSDAYLAADLVLWKLWREAKHEWGHFKGKLPVPTEPDRRVPTFIVIDEAHNFAPEAPENRLQARVSDRIAQIAAEGRKYGLYLVLATQRPRKLRKGLLAEFENSCIMLLKSKAERDAAVEMLGVSSDIAERAHLLKQGEGFLSGRWAGSTWKHISVASARATITGGDLADGWAQPRICDHLRNRREAQQPAVPNTATHSEPLNPDELNERMDRLQRAISAIVEAYDGEMRLAELGKIISVDYKPEILEVKQSLGVDAGWLRRFIEGMPEDRLRYDPRDTGWVSVDGHDGGESAMRDADLSEPDPGLAEIHILQPRFPDLNRADWGHLLSSLTAIVDDLSAQGHRVTVPDILDRVKRNPDSRINSRFALYVLRLAQSNLDFWRTPASDTSAVSLRDVFVEALKQKLTKLNLGSLGFAYIDQIFGESATEAQG